MSEDNRNQGRSLYATGDAETRAWFECQWAIWPTRADERFTTNLSFHHGGVIAYREEHGRSPEMSRQFRENAAYLDKQESVEP